MKIHFPLSPNFNLPVVAFCLTLLFALGACATPAATSTPAASTAPTEAASATSAPSQNADNTNRPATWTDASHGDDVDPNYAVVFPQDKVNEIQLTIAPADWAAMQADILKLLGERGARGSGPNDFPRNGDFPPGGGNSPDFGNGNPPPGGFGGGRGFGGDMTPVNPMWVPATVEFDGKTWTNVGVRYKGNSSLRSSWNSGSLKLPLKFDFDEFKDDHPEINNQRFYGFKQLSFANGFGDNTYLREATIYDLLAQAGLVASNTAYYKISLDYGEGVQDLGLYTAVEVTDDTVIKRTFGDDDGNIYEADGPAASFAEGTSDQIKDSFQKENNEDAADWSDLEKLYDVINSNERTTNPEAWRAQLDAVFDTDTFLKWLALSALMQHWDTYGAMTHNYYLYHDTKTDHLTWISWDHNLVLGASGRGFGGGANPNGGNMQGGGNFGGGGFGGRMNVTFDKKEVGTNWPLIRYLMDDPTYYAKYVSDLQELTEGIFDADTLTQKFQARATLVRPYVQAELGADAFDTALQQLIQRTQERDAAAAEFLSTN